MVVEDDDGKFDEKFDILCDWNPLEHSSDPYCREADVDALVAFGRLLCMMKHVSKSM